MAARESGEGVWGAVRVSGEEEGGGEREGAGRGFHAEGEGEEEIRGGKITVLPFPYFYYLRDSPNLNTASLIRNRFLNPNP